MSYELPSQIELDAARRLSDIVSLHLVAHTDIKDVSGKWIAALLEDGRSDGNLYFSKDEAMRFQSDPKRCCYLKITPDGITTKDAWHFLKINRHSMIDVTAPEPVINPALYPRFSNLTRGQKLALRGK